MGRQVGPDGIVDDMACHINEADADILCNRFDAVAEVCGLAPKDEAREREADKGEDRWKDGGERAFHVCVFWGLGIHAVTDAADGFDVRGPGAEFAAEAHHLRVDRAVGDSLVLILREVDDLGARVDATLMLHEKTQEAKFHARQIEGLVIECDGVGRIVERETIQGMKGVDAGGGAAQDSFDARKKNRLRKGLGDVIIRAHFKPLDNIFFGSLCCEHDNGCRGRGRRFANAAANREAVHARQHQVKKDERGFFAKDHFEA